MVELVKLGWALREARAVEQKTRVKQKVTVEEGELRLTVDGVKHKLREQHGGGRLVMCLWITLDDKSPLRVAQPA